LDLAFFWGLNFSLSFCPKKIEILKQLGRAEITNPKQQPTNKRLQCPLSL